MAEPPDDEQEEPARRGRMQFGLGPLFLVTTIAAISAGGLAGMIRRPGSGALPPYFFVLLTAAVPVGLMIFFSLVRAAVDAWRRR